jgi:predicted dehydrogenase
VELARSETREWEHLPDSAGYIDTGRGIGLADLAEAIEHDLPHRASGRLGLHVLEIMDAIQLSSARGETIAISSTVERPAPVPLRTVAEQA